jgi:hypothetical protein
MGYYVLEFFIGVGSRDIMTKELSLTDFFVLFCLSIFSTWDNLFHVNPMMPSKPGEFCSGMYYTGIS